MDQGPHNFFRDHRDYNKSIVRETETTFFDKRNFCNNDIDSIHFINNTNSKITATIREN